MADTTETTEEFNLDDLIAELVDDDDNNIEIETLDGEANQAKSKSGK